MRDYDAVTGLSRTVLSTATDSGGGVPAACRKLGCSHRSCFLHDGDSAQGKAYGIRQTRPPSALLAIRDVVKKVRECVNEFAHSNQRVEGWLDIQRELNALFDASKKIPDTLFDEDAISALASLTPGLELLRAGEQPSGSQLELPDDLGALFDSGSAALDALDLDDDALISDVICVRTGRTKRLVKDGETRCWSITDMLATFMRERAAAPADRRDLEFCWFLRVVETASGEDDRECSGKPRTVRVAGAI